MTEKLVTIGDQQTTVRLGEHDVEVVAVRGHEAEIRVAGRTHLVPFVVQGTTVSFAFEGETYTADVSDKGARKARQREHSMSAPMPGVVTKILVREGGVVAKGAALIVLEAMKMEHQIIAPYDGTVTKVNCTEGELVQPGVDLIELAQNEDPS